RAFSNALTETIIDRISALSESEIYEAYRSYSVNQETLGLHLRGNGEGGMSSDPVEFITAVQQARTDCSHGGPIQSEIEKALAAQVQKRLSAFTEAAPDQFSQTSTMGLTPAHALLLAYSVISDDPLAGNRKALRVTIDALVKFRPSRDPGPFTEPKGYGQYGYVYASPIE